MKYIQFTVIEEGATFGSPETQQRVIVRSDLVDSISEVDNGCMVKLGAGLGIINVIESFDDIKVMLDK